MLIYEELTRGVLWRSDRGAQATGDRPSGVGVRGMSLP